MFERSILDELSFHIVTAIASIDSGKVRKYEVTITNGIKITAYSIPYPNNTKSTIRIDIAYQKGNVDEN